MEGKTTMGKPSKFLQDFPGKKKVVLFYLKKKKGYDFNSQALLWATKKRYYMSSIKCWIFTRRWLSVIYWAFQEKQ